MASEVYANRMGWPGVVAVTAPPLLLAGLGLTHPHDLTGVSAGWWTSLHIILVPLFPLLGVSHWVLLHGRPGVIAWIGRVAAFLYIAFYAVTDHIAGIGTGVVMQQSGASSTSERPEIGWLFGVANDVGGAGAWALALAAVATAVVAVRDGGQGPIESVHRSWFRSVAELSWRVQTVAFVELRRSPRSYFWKLLAEVPIGRPGR